MSDQIIEQGKPSQETQEQKPSDKTSEFIENSKRILREQGQDPKFSERQSENQKVISELLSEFQEGNIKLEELAEVLAVYQTGLELAKETAELNADTDPLTKLYNRRGFLRRTEEVLALANRYHEPFSFAIVDVDNFKKINDQYGHDVGDTVLKAVANHLKQNSRTSDIVGRWGGEEFILLMPSTDEEGAAIHMDKLRSLISIAVAKKLAEVNITIDESITISVGTAGEDKTKLYDLTPKQEIDKLTKIADERLYEAKRTGKNRVVSSIGIIPSTEQISNYVT